MAVHIRLKRIYEDSVPDDGYRVLVERLWPRGLTKDRARVDWWAKDVAPSPELRRWYGHRPERWSEFRRRYTHELLGNPMAIMVLDVVYHGLVTFLYAARDRERNSARVLKEFMENHTG